ncbi:DUF7289 family protein [Halolamina sp. C58]|uniref:DUF7289 family protein n=1 Tax=Halolamina sp. C58 TaxID=3421640 RepID=UPI003EBB252B
MIRDRRGVSETVGFVLVFSLVLLTVGTVLTVGYGGLQDVRDAERVNNAQRAFDVLANNIEDITARGAPSRGTEIRLAEASLGRGEPTILNISADWGASNFSTGNDSLGSIVYEAEGTQIRYAAGAVTRVQSDGSVMLVDPNFVISDRRVILPVVELVVEQRSIAGSRTVLVRSVRNDRTVELDREAVDRFELNVTSPATDAWEGYLEDEGMNCSRLDDDRLACSIENLDRVQVVRFTIEVTFG